MATESEDGRIDSESKKCNEAVESEYEKIVADLNNQMPQTHEKEINILLWNVNGIKTKDYEFQHFLEEETIVIVLITETKLPSKARYKLPRHLVYITDRQHGKGGGTLIVIKKDIMHTPTGSQQDSTTIIIPTPIGEMAVAVVYSPPGVNNLKENSEAIFKKAPIFYNWRRSQQQKPSLGMQAI
ncbi:hypothetical protein PR048_001437 [Dryococelus australis]|uniref:Uncharacterized protein n=1 Tax=Dryococelus australis TaxID=614101 RepID=A0ABQ9IIU6_9NEOP|nr:hypothetical protein PR048_001437 [Dryococelus australis]